MNNYYMEFKTNSYFLTILQRARVARLSTVDDKHHLPHIVPVVFVFDDNYYYIPIDKKKKKQAPDKLKRVRNIQENPNVALLIDEYNEDWRELVFVMIQGKANLLKQEKEQYNNNNQQLEKVHKLLYQKYSQYKDIGIGQCCIKIHPQKIIFWSNK
jgi:PPOX class probable F420-dependent enzyme